MIKAGQTMGRKWDDVGQTPDPITSVPWRPRTDGLKAILVNPRTTVFDRPAPEIAKAESEPEVATALGPVPQQWTWDLVHCRLLWAHSIASRLPRVLVPATYRSFLGSLQPQEATMRLRPLTDDDTKRYDWTMSRVDCWSEIDRVVLKGIMSGHTLSQVAKATCGVANRFGGEGLAKTSVYRRYRTNTTIMAAEWIDLREPIDQATRECWLIQSSHGR